VQAVAVRVRAEHAEAALDRLLPIVSGGVYERELGPFLELTVVGGPSRAELEAALGAGVVSAVERELPDDPGERLALLLESPVIANRFLIRSPSAPVPTDPSLEDIVIDRGSAFGTGLHPTTRRCLELLLALEPRGSFADLGCGTGVLAIAAARLGWSPVTAVDYDAASVASAAANAYTNGVEVDARQVDLVADPPPAAQTIVANVPPHVQAGVRANLVETPSHLILSGITPAAAGPIVDTYADLGLVERRRLVEADWAAVLLTAPDLELREHVGDEFRVRVPAAAADVPAAALGTPVPQTLLGQLSAELPDGSSAHSSSCALPTGARVAVLLAPGLFRLDVRHMEDTLKISLRNLAGTPILSLPDTGPPRTIITTEDVTVKRPLATNSRMRLRIGTGSAQRAVEIVLSALSGVQPGMSRITAQAVVKAAGGTSEPPPNVSS
jgi:ribosomal protein L11 methyltransferase